MEEVLGDGEIVRLFIYPEKLKRGQKIGMKYRLGPASELNYIELFF